MTSGNIFLTADLHINHTKIIKHCSRPFGYADPAGRDTMNAELVARWNSVVKDGDRVYVLGDMVTFTPDPFEIAMWLRKLNGTIYLLPGNHDELEAYRSAAKEDGVKLHVLEPVVEIGVCSQVMTLCHYKMSAWNRSHYGALHVYGHAHGARLPYDVVKEDDGSMKIVPVRAMDVGVDTNNFYPYAVEDVVERLLKIPIPKSGI